MAEPMMNRAERREEIKLILEYLRLIAALGVIVTIIFGVLQWRNANRAAEFANNVATLNAYERMANEWRDHLRTFIERPNLRPYFEGRQLLGPNDQNREIVLALADVRLDVMDAVLTYAAMRMPETNIAGWQNTFAEAFRRSPVLCDRLRESLPSFQDARILPIYRANCPT